MTASARLQTIAFCLLAALPPAMAVANRSAPALLATAGLLALAARALAGELAEIGLRLRRLLGRPLASACLVFLAFGAASLAWTHHPRHTLLGLAEITIAAFAPLLLHLCLPRLVPRRVLVVAAIAAALACASILVELATGQALRQALGFRSESFIFKRSVTSILIVFWPLAALLWCAAGRRLVPVLLAALLLAAILWSHAAAALLGFAAGGAALALAAGSRRAAAATLGAGLLLALGLAPVVGDLAARVLPDRVLDALHDSQARDRVLIWQTFGEVVRLRPLAGLGFGTSAATGRDPVAAEVPVDRRVMLAVGHPHNGYLQVWSETGAAGALIAAIVLALLLRGVAKAPPRTALSASAAIACAGAIMLVAHGAWQGWWIATIGAAAVWLVRDLEPAQSGSAAPRKPVAST